MNIKQPLDDSWLFWDAERIDDFPHVIESQDARREAKPSPDGDAEHAPHLRLLEDVVLYVAGISAAMMGVALAVLIGSFLSAYAALNDADGRGAVAGGYLTPERAGAPRAPAGPARPEATGATLKSGRAAGRRGPAVWPLRGAAAIREARAAEPGVESAGRSPDFYL